MTDSTNETPAPDAAVLQVDEVSLGDLLAKLSELGEQLRRVSERASNRERGDYIRQLQAVGGDPTDEEVRLWEAEDAEAFRRTLTGLREFRRDYSYWERVLVEYALTRKNITQRDAAQLLGVGVSTINRWAQHPLEVPNYS